MKQPKQKGLHTKQKTGGQRSKSRRCVVVATSVGPMKVQTDGGRELSPRTLQALDDLAKAAKAQITSRTRHCSKPGCAEVIAFDRVACKPHWYELPAQVRAQFAVNLSPMERAMVFREAIRLLKTPIEERQGCKAAGCECLHFDAAECAETGADLESCECGHHQREHTS